MNEWIFNHCCVAVVLETMACCNVHVFVHIPGSVVGKWDLKDLQWSAMESNLQVGICEFHYIYTNPLSIVNSLLIVVNLLLFSLCQVTIMIVRVWTGGNDDQYNNTVARCTVNVYRDEDVNSFKQVF